MATVGLLLLAPRAWAGAPSPRATFEAAGLRATARHAACKLPPPRRSEAAPQASLAAMLAALRREQVAADLLPAPMRSPYVKVVYVRYSRFLRRVGDTRYFVLPLLRRSTTLMPTRACGRAVMREVRAALRGASTRALRRASTYARRRLKTLRTRERMRVDGLALVSVSDDGFSFFAGATSAREFRRHGNFATFSSSETETSARLLVPDGVASVDLSYDAATAPDGRQLAAQTVSAAVDSNLAVATIDRPAEMAFKATITWRDATGAAIKTYRTG